MRINRLRKLFALGALSLVITACASGTGNANEATAASFIQHKKASSYNLEIQNIPNNQIKAMTAGNPTIASSLPNANFRAIAKGNGIYVVVGDNGTILTSSNGNDWMVRTSNLDINFHDITFNTANNLFYVVGDTGKLLSSPDGINWTTYKTLTPAANLYSIVAGDGHIVIGADSSTIFEIDPAGRGLVTVRTTVDNMRLVTASYGDGMFTMGSDDGSILYKSINNWNTSNWFRAIKFSNKINSISYDEPEKIFLAVQSSGSVISSPNGITWSSPVATLSKNLSSIFMDPTSYKFYAVGGTINNSSIISSDDFNAWNTYPRNFANNLNSIRCFAEKDCYIVGDHGTILSGVTRNADQTPNWNQVTGDKVLLNSGQIVNNANGNNGTKDVQLLSTASKTFVVQGDGNLVCYSGSTPLWASITNKTVKSTPLTVQMKITGELTAIADLSYNSKTLSNGAYLVYQIANNSVVIMSADGVTILKKLC